LQYAHLIVTICIDFKYGEESDEMDASSSFIKPSEVYDQVIFYNIDVINIIGIYNCLLVR